MGKHGTGRNKRTIVSIYSGPPEMSLQKGQDATSSRMAGKPRSMPPLKNLRTDGVWYKEMTGEPISWVRLNLKGFSKYGLNLPGFVPGLSIERVVQPHPTVRGIHPQDQLARWDRLGHDGS